MSKRNWLMVGAAAVLLALGLAWYFLSPSYTLAQMKAAAEANDADAMSRYIDYEALREDLKAELMAQMMVEAQEDTSEFGALGMAIGSAMIGPMVDGFVSPAGMRAAFTANRQRQRANQQMRGSSAFQVSEDPVITRRGLDEFAVSSGDGKDGSMVFKRHGLGWKLSGVDLPARPPSERDPAASAEANAAAQEAEDDFRFTHLR